MTSIPVETARVARAPEVRYATFVMGDIVDSTRLANQLDLDDQRALASAFRSLVLRLAQRHGGHVLRFEGDGAFVAFGHPEPSEDAAESAVRYGLELAAAVGGIDVVPAVTIQVRVGVASGRVAIGDLIDAAANVEEAIEGPVPAMAERLKTAAEPGEVVIAESTRSQAANFFFYRDLGAIAAKGFDGGLHGWKVLGETGVASRFEAQRFDAARGGIVGRDAEAAQLAKALQQALHGNGSAVALIGDAGLGKSHLAHGVLGQARQAGAAVFEIDCTPRTRNSPLFPVGVLLRRIAHVAPALGAQQRSDRVQRLLEGVVGADDGAAMLPYLAPLFGIDGPALSAHPTPGEVRAQTLTAIIRIVRALAARGPMVMLCEDLHWSDPSTLEVLHALAAQIAALPVLMLATSRSLSDAAIDAQHFGLIELRPLRDDDAARLVRGIAAAADLAAELVRDIVARSEGVPLYLEELTHNALEAARVGEPQTLATVPATLQLVVQARLSRWPQLKTIVQAASVLGREFSVRLLEQMLPDRRAEIDAALALLSAHGLFAAVDPQARGRAQFRHALIRDTVYQTLLRGDRQRLHSCAADVLAAGDLAAPEASPEILALHLFEARRVAEAVHVQLDAAAHAAARGAFAEAAGYCESALPRVEEVQSGPDRRLLHFSVLVQRAVALSGRSGYAASEVAQAYQAAHALCDASVTAQLRYPIVRGLAGLHLVRGQLAAAHAFSLQGVDLAEQCGDLRYRIDALSMQVYTTLYYRRLDECRLLIDRFLQLYREADGARLSYPSPHDAGTAVLSVVPTVAWLLGDSAGCESAVAAGLAHVGNLGRPFDEAMMHAWVAGTRYTQRRYLDAAQHAMRAVEISAPRGFREWLATGGLMGLLAQSALQPSQALLDQARQVCLAFASQGVGLNASYYAWGLARACLGLQQWHEAEATLAMAVAQAKASGETRMDAELLLMQARLPSRAEQAARLVREAWQTAEAQGDRVTALRAAAELTLLDAGDSEAAGRARDVLAALDGRVAVPAEPQWVAQQYAAIQQLRPQAVH